jgi:hypothetical protein
MRQGTSGFINVFQIYPNMFRQVVAIFRGVVGALEPTQDTLYCVIEALVYLPFNHLPRWLTHIILLNLVAVKAITNESYVWH